MLGSTLGGCVECWGLHWEGVLNVGVGGCAECWGGREC